jgi:hypothetical protein
MVEDHSCTRWSPSECPWRQTESMGLTLGTVAALAGQRPRSPSLSDGADRRALADHSGTRFAPRAGSVGGYAHAESRGGGELEREIQLAGRGASPTHVVGIAERGLRSTVEESRSLRSSSRCGGGGGTWKSRAPEIAAAYVGSVLAAY